MFVIWLLVLIESVLILWPFLICCFCRISRNNNFVLVGWMGGPSFTSNQKGLGKVPTNLFKIIIEKNSVIVVYISVTSAVLPYSSPR